MKEILNNVALLSLNDYCKQNNIDYSGTHIYKYPRRFTYALCEDETNRALVTMTLYKNKVPTYFRHNNS